MSRRARSRTFSSAPPPVENGGGGEAQNGGGGSGGDGGGGVNGGARTDGDEIDGGEGQGCMAAAGARTFVVFSHWHSTCSSATCVRGNGRGHVARTGRRRARSSRDRGRVWWRALPAHLPSDELDAAPGRRMNNCTLPKNSTVCVQEEEMQAELRVFIFVNEGRHPVQNHKQGLSCHGTRRAFGGGLRVSVRELQG